MTDGVAERIAEAQRDVLVAARAWREAVGGGGRAPGSARELAAAAAVLAAKIDWLDALERRARAERSP